MNVAEFSNEFDLLYNNIMSNAAPSINEYEKSVFLTKAQEEIVKNYFNPKGNKYGEGFDDSIKRQSDFSQLISTDIYPGGTITKLSFGNSIDSRSIFFTLPLDLLFILNESVLINDSGKTVITQVVPLRYEEYTRLMNKPYKEPLKHQSWRLLSQHGGNKQTEIIIKSGATLLKYLVRYLKRPEPIILVNLTSEYNGATINNRSTAMTCQLDESLHREILNRAVELAKMSYLGDIKGIIELNSRGE